MNEPACPEGIRLHADLPYAGTDEVRQTLDLYLPEDAAAPLPVIVLIHGGGWAAGSKGSLGGEEHFVRGGFALARINYRYSTDAKHPAQLEDCRSAVRWLRAHADEYGLDPVNVFAIGHSAGGHLASLLGCAAPEAPGTAVRAVVNQAGGTDLLHLGRERKAASTPDKNRAGSIERLLGGPVDDDPERAWLASPMAYVDADTVPHLLIYGGADEVVPKSEGERFHAAMREAGAPSEMHVLPDAGHVSEVFWQTENLERVLSFFRRHLA